MRARAGERRQACIDGVHGGPRVAPSDDPPFRVVGIALLAPAHREAVALAPVHHERDGLGGFAERKRQQTRRERIERAGVTRAARLEQPLDHRDRVGRCHSDRLVEDDPAMYVALLALVLDLLGLTRLDGILRRGVALARLVLDHVVAGQVVFSQVLRNHWSSSAGLSRSRLTSGVRSIFSIRSASSKRSSARKRMSGANFRLTRCASSARTNFLLRSSAATTSFSPLPPSGIT